MTPLLALLCLLPTPDPGGSQPGEQGPEALGQVRSESGRPVAGAVVRFVPEPVHGMPWRSWLDPLPESSSATTDADGRFRFAAPAGPGCLWAEHEDGIGCFEPRSSTGVPTPLEARALGSLTLADGSPFAASIRALRPGAGSVWLGVRTGEEVRLPAGSYLLLLEQAGRRSERRVRVEPGRRQVLEPPTGTGPRLRPPAGTRIALGRWPGIEARDAEDRLPELAGPDVVRALVPQGADRDIVLEVWSEDLTPADVTAPPRASWARLQVQDPDGRPVPDGTVLTVRDEPGGPRVLARSVIHDGAAAAARLEPSSSHRVFAMVVGAGAGVAVVDLASTPAVIVLPPARPATIRVEGPDGDPVVGATVEVRCSGPRLLDRLLTTDGRGQVRVARADTADDSALVSVRSDDHLPREARLELLGDGPVEVLRLERGLEIHGAAWLDPDRRAAAVEVELRDTTATLGLADRITVTAEDGSFVFRGLPDGIYTLFAHGRIDGVTWSAKVRGVQPGPDEWRIDLRNEDPEPPGGRRRAGR